MKLRPTAALALVLGASACSAGGEAPNNLGELGAGSFFYVCVEDGDAKCNSLDAAESTSVTAALGPGDALPAAIAVGSRFDLDYWGDTSDGSTELNIKIVPARPEVVETGSGFTMLVPGRHAFLARDATGIVADFIHLTAATVTDLDLWKDQQRVTALSLVAGTEAQLAAVPNDASGLALAGGLPYAWTVDDETVAAVDLASGTGIPSGGLETSDDEVRVVAIGPGETTLHIARGEVKRDLAVTVTGGGGS